MLLFASVKEIVGQSSVKLTVSQETITVNEIRELIKGATGADQSLQQLLDRCMVAIQNEYCMDGAQEF